MNRFLKLPGSYFCQKTGFIPLRKSEKPDSKLTHFLKKKMLSSGISAHIKRTNRAT